MIGLLANELLRFWYRLSIRWLVALVLAGLSLAGVVVYFGHSADPPDLAAIKAEQVRQQRECVDSNSGGNIELPAGQTIQDFCGFGYGVYVEDERFCAMEMLISSACELVNGTAGYTSDPSTVSRPVDFAALAQAESFPPTDQYGRPIGDAPSRGYQSGYFTGMALLALMVAVLVGSTFVGAEFRAGTVESALVVEPRRLRLLVARYTAGLIGITVLTGGLLGFHLLTLLPTILGRSDSDAVLPGFWGAVAWSVVRIALVSGAVGLVAMALSTLGKHTVAGVGGLLGYLIVGQVMVLVLVRSLRPVEFAQNVMAVVTRSDVVRVHTGGYEAELVAHGPTAALGYVAVYVGVLAAVSGLVFARRDVD